MVSKFALINSILLASAALAVPPSSLEARFSRRRENRRSPPINIVTPSVTDPYLSGAVLTEPAGTFTIITGTFTVPTALEGGNGALSVWVGIDGYTCGNSNLQTGIDLTSNDGEVTYDAFYEWYPEYAYTFSGITISAGDVITATVTASSTTSGTAIIENLTTGQTVTQPVTSSYALCEQDAEWIVEEPGADEGLAPLMFSTVTFTNATASGPSGVIYTPPNATSLLMAPNGETLTSVSTSGETLTIEYV